MARSKPSERAQRDATDVSNDLDELLAPLLSPLPTVTVSVPDILSTVEDRRTFSPEGALRPPLSVSGNQAPITQKFNRVVGTNGHYPSFADARHAAECHRRKTRREVLHALNRTRSGRGGKRRRSDRSNIHC